MYMGNGLCRYRGKIVGGLRPLRGRFAAAPREKLRFSYN